MARLARVVAPGCPHHVTQRGNRRQQTFFRDADYRAYPDLMAEWCGRRGVEIWAYCLMPNHVHLIATPETEDGLRRAIGEAQRRYTRHINRREDWRGYLWQGRFASFPMDQPHLLMAARYIELNPLRTRLVGRAADYPEQRPPIWPAATTGWSRSHRCWRWSMTGPGGSATRASSPRWRRAWDARSRPANAAPGPLI